AVMEKEGRTIACVVVEPVAGNMGLVPPVPGFLEALRELTQRFGSLLVFDEVISGFRVSRGGAQALYGVTPDLTCLGKIIGGGLPVGAYGGRRDLMAHIAPLGAVYQAGTLSGNPVAMAAGIATLTELGKPGFYEALEQTSARLADGLQQAASRAGIPARVDRVGSLLGFFFTDRPVNNFADAKTSDLDLFAAYYRGMLERRIYLAPSQFEALFVSAAHTAAHIDETVQAAEAVLDALARRP
ncbi:MAG: aminotransferase class III-fold pyridoxal phosphate-dependent enzyme, partial [Desulfobacterales bacterium]|nr:aminotransferase class III-fold pyridoxal phosphate-dependent enzyme [Desulfobacterales bacterium]